MADKQKTKSQHTVPRCYLRGFADEKQNFYSFNKRYQKATPASVGQSAQSDFFYDLEPSTLQNPTDDPQLVEKTFALLEKRFKEVLDDVIAGAKTGEVRAESADYLAQFIALQWLRTRGARNTMVEVDAKTMQALVNLCRNSSLTSQHSAKQSLSRYLARGQKADSKMEGVTRRSPSSATRAVQSRRRPVRAGLHEQLGQRQPEPRYHRTAV